MKKKVILLLVVTVYLCKEMKVKSIDEFFVMMGMVLGIYFTGKFILLYTKGQIRASGGFFSWFMSMIDTTRYDKQIMDNVWNSVQSRMNSGCGAYDAGSAKREADQRVFNRTKAQNEAKFHQYYANKNAGSYDGYRSANRAREAQNRANRY